MKVGIFMDFSNRLAISYYKNIAVINESHKIYLAQHQSTNKIYIKKILDVYNINIYKHLFEHPILGTPRIIDFCEDNNQLILIEEYISGSTLAEIIKNKKMTSNDIRIYMCQLCVILNKLHAQSPPIIHRDIKPSNIIITSYNHVILLDFNAAKHFCDTSKTDTMLLGTQGYAAPEQYGFGSSSPQTDIYALGIMLKEMTASLITKTNEFDPIIAKCTQLNPDDRYQNVSELLCNLSAKSTTVSKARSSKRLSRYILPGYRMKTPWKMAIASLAYVTIIGLCLSLNVKGVHGPALWVERIFCLPLMLSIIFGCFNYMNIQRGFSLCRSSKRLVRYLGIALLDLLMFTSIFLILVIIEMVFFNL